MPRVSCPHCGYRNTSAQNFCSRCEQSLHEAPETAEAAHDELKTQVDLRLEDFAFGEPAPRATGPTDLHANLVPQKAAPGADVPLTERPTAPWPEGQSAQSHAPEASSTTVEPWAQATSLLSAEEMKASTPENWRMRGRAAPAPEQHQHQHQPPPQAPAARVASRPKPAPQAAAPLRPAAKAAPGTRKLESRERLRDVVRAESAPATQARVLAAPARATPPAAADTPLWPSPGRQLAALGLDALVWLGGSMALLSLLIASMPKAAWPAERPTLLEALAMWLAHSGRAPLLWFVGSAALAALYTLWGSASGRTVGRLLMGLKLVDGRGQVPGVGAGMWHILGGALGIGALGAGLLWPILDPAARTWASLTSRTYVIRA